MEGTEVGPRSRRDERKRRERQKRKEGREGDPSLSKCLHVHSLRLWDYFNSREEETLDSLPQVAPTPRSQQTTQQEEMWLNYEPDVSDLEFL